MPAKIFVVGDSLTMPFGVPIHEGWCARLGMRPEWDVSAVGLPGATTRRWLQTALWVLEVMPWSPPDWAIIALGGNESVITRPAGVYADHVRQMILHLRKKVPGLKIACLRYHELQVPLQPTGCDDSPGWPAGCTHAQPPHTWAQYGQALASVAAANGASVINVADKRDWRPFLIDGAHLDAEGHRLLEGDVHSALLPLLAAA